VAEDRVHRRLAAILAADVVGYSRLMGEDEAGTRARFNAHLNELIEPTIARGQGRIVKTTGDGLLVEFASVVDAVQCAVEIQDRMRERNADEPDDRRMEFRIGVNLGDVIIEGEDIHGDGVNVAARLEGLCEPGGVYVSGTVHDHVEGKLAARFKDLGEKVIKNMAKPVKVYSVRVQSGEVVNIADAAEPLPLPDKPSIAVLPFDNMSGDPEQEYFSDGITEDIITALSHIRQFFVIARNTTFTYKGQAVDVQAVAKDLGVRYVLEGSVRKAGNRVRISAQLIDGTTGNHLWAERYDRDLEDIFELQDEITLTVVGAIEPELAQAEREQAMTKRPDDLNAWDLFQQGMFHLHKRTREAAVEALSLFERAIEMNPNFSGPYSGSAYIRGYAIRQNRSDVSDDNLESAVQTAERAIELDPNDAFARVALGNVRMGRRELDKAELEFRKAIELNPSSAFAHMYVGHILGHQLEFAEQGLTHLELAIRLSPRDPYTGPTMGRMSAAHYLLGNYENTVEYARKALQYPATQIRQNAFLVAALTILGREDEAQFALQDLWHRDPAFTCSQFQNIMPVFEPESIASVITNLRKAGLPE